MIEIMFYEQSPISKFWVGDICFDFDGSIYDFHKLFPNCQKIETEGAGIWIIKNDS